LYPVAQVGLTVRAVRKEIQMRGKLLFVAGAAVGYVLGTKAGRERYNEMMDAARKILDSPSVHEATGVAQAQATKLYARGKETLAASPLSDRLRHPMGTQKDDIDGFLSDDPHQTMSSNSF
jgi:hypothetical protein